MGEAPVDSDSDGLTDSWEQFWFEDLTQTGNQDFDRDGRSNAQEGEKASNPKQRLAPTWWQTQTVLSPVGSTNDFVLVNAGQLKWVASRAAAEMDARLDGGAVSNLVNQFTHSNNFAAANLGLLKSLARPFYDRLISIASLDLYPWANAPTTNNSAGATVGQTKHIFSFEIPAP